MTNEKMLRLPEVAKMVGIGKSTVWKWMNTRGFPKQVKLSTKVAAWKLSDIQAWIQTQIDTNN